MRLFLIPFTKIFNQTDSVQSVFEVGANIGMNMQAINQIDSEIELRNKSLESEIIFVAIQTPHEERYEGVTRLPDDRVDFDYTYLKEGITSLSTEIEDLAEDRIVVIISTVLPGTIRREIMPVLSDHVKLCYNPFFIAMGTTMRDFLKPEFVLLGVDNDRAASVVEDFYTTIHDRQVYRTAIENAELELATGMGSVGSVQISDLLFGQTESIIIDLSGLSIDNNISANFLDLTFENVGLDMVTITPESGFEISFSIMNINVSSITMSFQDQQLEASSDFFDFN